MGVVGYKTIIDNMQDILQAANTTSADHYLSKNMANKVLNVSKRNPNFLASNPHQLPAICLRIDEDAKTIEEMGRSLSNKQTELTFSVIGLLYYTALIEGNTEDNDPADDEIHYFAENTEEVLRRNHKMNNTVLWSYPDRISFYEDLDEESYYRTFVMDYKVKLFY